MFLQRIYMMASRHMKMFKITSHQGNANPSPIKYYFTPMRMAFKKKKRKISFGKYVEKLECCALLVGI